MNKPKMHLIGLFHTVPNHRTYSACAFTGKVLRWAKMMNMYGWKTIEYANGVSESEASEHVQMLTEDELDGMTGRRGNNDFHGNTAVIGTPWWAEFDKRLRVALKERVKKGDFILHPFGLSHWKLKQDFPEQAHVETGIGYPDAPFGAYRIFESRAWQAFHQGKHNQQGSDYEHVVPNFYDMADWTPNYHVGTYNLFMGRIYEGKGMSIIKALAEAGVKITVAGQGDFAPYKHPNLEYIGPVLGKDRDALVGGARCMLMPTRFIEPFGGSGVEAQACAAPLISSDWGGFGETVEHGVSGFRCHTLGDWLKAIELAPMLDRHRIAARARSLYSLETCGAQYDKIFTQINDLWKDGWYTRRPLFVP